MQSISNGVVPNGTCAGPANGTTTNGITDIDCYSTANDGEHQTIVNLSDSTRDVIRLIGQYLKNAGLIKSADLLMAETGLRLDHPVAIKFRQHILDGDWIKADHDIDELKSLVDKSVKFVEMKFIILEQKYLEYLEDGLCLDALFVLRNELTPLQHNIPRLHQLSSYMMCANMQELRDTAQWDGKGIKSRTILLNKIQQFLPPSFMLPPSRLYSLLNQALNFQQIKCTYHNSSTGIIVDNCSLLVDHKCAHDSFPTHTVQILNNHSDEVWFCQFSPNGKRFATASKDTRVIIWDVHADTCTLSLNKVLEGHNYGASYLAWHPDSVHLLVCGPEESPEVWLWNTDTRKLVKVSQSPDDALACCAWNASGTKFVTGGIRGHFYQCDMDGNVTDSWEGVRVHGLHCRKDGKTVIACDTHHRLRGYVFDDLTDHNLVKEDHAIMSFTVDKKDRLAVLNVSTQGVHLWDLEDKCLVRRFQGVTQGHFTIYSSFGGVNQDFIASGSEDNQVYIWHIQQERPIAILQGHCRTVNCVAWNPVSPDMLVSVSDDNMIRVWGPKYKVSKYPGDSPLD